MRSLSDSSRSRLRRAISTPFPFPLPSNSTLLRSKSTSWEPYPSDCPPPKSNNRKSIEGHLRKMKIKVHPPPDSVEYLRFPFLRFFHPDLLWLLYPHRHPQPRPRPRPCPPNTPTNLIPVFPPTPTSTNTFLRCIALALASIVSERRCSADKAKQRRSKGKTRLRYKEVYL
jgi:hypothetical protein